jgi:hypothetical protein
MIKDNRHFSSEKRVNKNFLNIWMIPLLEKHREFVRQIYPDAYFNFGYIYTNRPYHQLTSARFDNNGIEAEYYAWMWASDFINDELLRKLES